MTRNHPGNGSAIRQELVRFADFHDKSVSRGQKLSRRASEEREYKVFEVLQVAFMPLGGGSCSMQNQTSICCLRPASGLEQKIEFVLSCQSRNNPRESRELTLRHPVGN
jgi:hypothetical protein